MFKLSLDKLKASWPVLTITDIHRYFPSLQWHRVIAQIARLAVLDGRDVDAALALHGKLWWYTDAVALGMPAGCDLSHVLARRCCPPWMTS